MKHDVIYFMFVLIVLEIGAEIGPIPLLKDNTISNISDVVTETITTEAIKTTTTTLRPLLQGLRLPCSCLEGQCGCCTGMILERFRQKACLNVTYEPDDFALTAKMTMNDRVLYKNTFSGKNPRPICIPVPRLRFITFCVEFSNIYFAKRNIHMCVDAEATWQDFTLIEWSFDCLRLGASGVAVVGEEEGGGLPPTLTDEEDQTDEDYDDSARNVPLPKIKQEIISAQTGDAEKPSVVPISARTLNNSDILFILDKNFDFGLDKD